MPVRHSDITDSHVNEEYEVIDAYGEHDSNCVLLFAQDVRINRDQKYGDGDEAHNVANHSSFAFPWQLQIDRFGHCEYALALASSSSYF